LIKQKKHLLLLKKELDTFRFKGDLPDEATAELKALNATRLASMTHANTVAFKDLNDAFENVATSGKENGFSQEQILKALDDAINPEIADSASQNEAFKTLIEADKALGFVKSDKLSVNTKPDQIRSKLSLFRSAKNVRGLNR
jgi:DNA-binding phage protein